MEYVVTVLEDEGFEAEPTDQKAIFKAAWWVVALQWVEGDLPHLAFDSALTILAGKLWKHYHAKTEAPPSRIDVYDAEGNAAISREVTEPEEDDEGGQSGAQP